MDLFNHKKQASGVKLEPGCMLIAEPLLPDDNFSRSVVLICETGSDGTVGFILNKPTVYTIEDLLTEFAGSTLSVYEGGPVQQDTLLMIHALPELLGGSAIKDGVYWGGSYDALLQARGEDGFNEHELRLMLGYSGWSAGQLEKEIEEGSWLIAPFDKNILFEAEVKNIWTRAIGLLGPQYAHLLNMPTDPRLN